MVSSRRALWLAFLTAFVTLFTQVLVHRMISAKLLNNYAFLVISLTMLGFACSGALLTRWLGLALERFRETVAACAALFSVSLLVASYAFYHSTASAQMVGSRPQFVLMLLRWVPLSLLYAIPFAFCGAILGILLAAPSLPTRRIYCFDLLGSAAGAFAVIPAIRYLGVETSCLLACGLMTTGALWLARPQGRAVWLLAGGAVLTAVFGGADRRFFDLYYPDGTMLAAGRDPKSGVVVEQVLWDPVARIEMSRTPPPSPQGWAYPCLIGTNASFHARFRRMLTQNNYAFTSAVDYDGRRESLTGIEETIYAAAYQAGAAPNPRVLVVGVGGGFDMLNALYFEASEVTGVEINQATVTMLTRTYRDYFRNWIEDPRVKLVSGEGRHYLATTDNRYDVIQLSGVDSYSGTAAAAHVFSENYLYTSEAWDIYLSHLTEPGIVNMMRLEFIPPREMLRALTTAVAALRRAGVANPANHIVMLTATNQQFTALLVKRTPFGSEERDRLIAWAQTSPYFGVSAAPGLNEAGENSNTYQAFLALNNPRREARFIAAYPHDISPADDNRPFFFKFSFWWHLFPSSSWIWESVPVMEYSVLMLLLLSGLAAIFCVYLPLRFLVARHQSATHPGRYATFFAGTGIGYLAIEIALLQKFGLFLGHPNYALSVVLAALLLTTGLGSLFSERIVSVLGQLRFVAYLLAAVVLLEYWLLLPRLPRGLALPFAAKTAVVFGLVAPIGACLGVFVPSAIEQLKRQAPAAVPWAWGVNGIFSVVAPVIAVAFSMSWGIDALLIASIPLYLVVGSSLPLPAPTAPEPALGC